MVGDGMSWKARSLQSRSRPVILIPTTPLLCPDTARSTQVNQHTRDPTNIYYSDTTDIPPPDTATTVHPDTTNAYFNEPA